MTIIHENWDNILDKIRQEYCSSNTSFKAFIAPLSIYEVTDKTLFILVKQSASIDHIERVYQLPFVVCVAEVTGKEYDVSFVTEDEEDVEKKKEIVENNLRMEAIFKKAKLNDKYTFDSFVVGKNNNFAQAAAFAVSDRPGEVYNPLFIYGGAGLGKTHLMHAIAHRILVNDPSKKVLYVTSENFTNEMIDALKMGKTGNELSMITFRDKYRNNDVLLIDDIQFLIGKESTQDEFFHTFNHLHISGKAVIISSDRPPNEVKTLDSRLKTRFAWGLTADISAPDFETRIAILKKKIDIDKLERYDTPDIPEKIIQYIAENIKSNIRELEGSLNRLIFLHRLNGRTIDIPLAAEAMKDFISSENRKVTDEVILEAVAEHYDLSVRDLLGPKRSANIALPRQVVMYLCRSMIDSPFKNVGIMLGGRDHSTVVYGADKIEKEIKENEELRNTVNIIRKKINPL